MQTITFFMIVTNRDVFIADYSIASFMKLVEPLEGKFSWKLRIYANCLTGKKKKDFFPRWSEYSYVEIYDNALHCSPDDFVPGASLSNEAGYEATLEGPFESCDTIWSCEFLQFTTDYWATVDADFEILRPDFVVWALKRLEENPKLAAVSSDKTEVKLTYDTYTSENIHYMERWNTWFCIYRKAAQACGVSHMVYTDRSTPGMTSVYDSASYFQKMLQEKYGFILEACADYDPEFYYSFIHYGAFAKNKSIDSATKTARYRRLCIGAHIGLPLLHRKAIISSLIRRVSKMFLLRFYAKAKAERTVFHFENDLDKDL